MINLFASVRSRYLGFFTLAVIAVGIFSCTDFPSLDIIKEEGIAYRYCVITKEGYCLKGPYSVCSKNGEPSNDCPYEDKVITLTYCVFNEDKLCLIGNFESCPAGGVVSNGCPWINPVEEDADEFDYCVFAADSICLKGPYAYSFCPKSAELSNECPKDFKGEYVDLSSSSLHSPSSSSKAESSSSLSLCGNSEYDPATEMCLDGSTVTFALCGVHIYNLKTGFCPKIINPSPYPRCGEIDGGEYDPHTQFCGTNNTVEEKVPCGNVHFDPTEQFCSGDNVLPLCGGSEYNTITQFCERNSAGTADSVYAKCGERTFNPTEQFCSASNIIQPLCGGKKLTLTQFCDKNSAGTADSVYTKCGNEKQYDPTQQFCHSNGTVWPKCKGNSFDPSKSFCIDNELFEKCDNKEYNVNIYECNPDGKQLVTIITDKRDNNKTYKAVSVGSQMWMAENLNYATTGSFCSDPPNCTAYGRLYTWAEAMALPDGCNITTDDPACRYKLPRQGICPENWHIPNDGEWSTLVLNAGGSVAGRELKAESGWLESSPGVSGNGWDNGFKALPGGWSDGTTVNDIGKFGYWWTTFESRDLDSAGFSIYYNMSSLNRSVNRDYGTKTSLYSVRCVYDGGK